MSGYGFTSTGTAYDDEDRLTGYQQASTNFNQSWALTSVGDWSSVTTNGTAVTRTHGPTHELLTSGGQNVTTDVKGNQTVLPASLATQAAQLAFAWDYDNKLKSSDIDNNGSADVTFEYDALGRRVARTEGSTAVVYFQADQQTIADYPRGGSASTATYRYVFASYIDEPVVRKTTGTSGTVLYYHRNQQYSIYALTDSSGAVSERYAFTAYGQPTFLNASATVQTSSAAGNRYTYTAREWDATIGLYHFRARWMSGLTGRFLTRDPIRYGTEQYCLYEYITAKALVRRDPFGLYGIGGDTGPCLWWLQRYALGGDNDVDLRVHGLFDEWRNNAGVAGPIGNAMEKAIGEGGFLSCDGKSGDVSTSWGGSVDVSTQVTGVPLCSRIGPIGGSSVSMKYNCDMSADCDECPECPECPDIYDSNSVLPKISCRFSFELEDQFSNWGDFGGPHNKPKDLPGWKKCIKKCEDNLGGSGEDFALCMQECREKHLPGNLVPVITDPYGYPYFIRAKWSEGKDSYGSPASCGHRPVKGRIPDEEE